MTNSEPLKKLLIGIIIFVLIPIGIIIGLQNTAGRSNKAGADILGWGNNVFGQIGEPKSPNFTKISQLANYKSDTVLQIATGPSQTIILNSDHTVSIYGNNFNDLNSYTEFESLKNVKAISTDNNYALALKEDGTVWSWGNNFTGQLGTGDNTNRKEPTQILALNDIVQIETGYKFGLALDKNGDLWAWGGSCSELNVSTAIKVANQPQPLNQQFKDKGGYYDENSSTNYISTSIQDCINQQIIGFSSKTPIKINSVKDIIQISSGYGHTLLLDKEGTVWAFGCNFYGQVGDTKDNSKPYKVPGLINILKVSAGYRHSLALDKDGNVWAWGQNLHGQLGIGENPGTEKLTEAIKTLDPTTNNKIKDPKKTELTDIKDIAGGYDYSLFLNKFGTLFVSGENNSGVVNSNKDILYVSTPTKFETDTHFKSLSAGVYHVVGIKK